MSSLNINLLFYHLFVFSCCIIQVCNFMKLHMVSGLLFYVASHALKIYAPGVVFTDHLCSTFLYKEQTTCNIGITIVLITSSKNDYINFAYILGTLYSHSFSFA